MTAFIIRRIIGMFAVLFAVSVLVYIVFILVPGGDPAERMAGKNPTPDNIQNIREKWGFDKPFYVQYVLIPYIGRPVRGQILSLREKEFIQAAVGQGAGPLRIMFSDLLPNVASTILVFFTLIIATNILTEAGLSFLGAGVRLPNPSWGNLIASGQDQIQTAPWLSLIPGIAIVLTVLSLNIFGDGLRDALDPRAKVRIEH